MQYEGRNIIERGSDGVKCPLVLALHGSFGNVYSFKSKFNLDNIVSNNVVTCYLNSKGFFWNAGESEATQTNDDVLYIASVVYNMKLKYDIDPDKVYILGHSNGGLMAYRAVEELKNTFNGVISISSPLVRDPKFEGKVYHIHGSQDNIVPFDKELKKGITTLRSQVKFLDTDFVQGEHNIDTLNLTTVKIKDFIEN